MSLAARPRPLLVHAVAAGVRMLRATIRITRPVGDGLPLPGPAVLAGWHGEQLPLLWAFRQSGMRVIVSRSEDGDLAAAALGRLGVETVRGSSSSGGAAALRAGIRHLRSGGRVAVLVDGPRGPRHGVAPGVAALAALGRAPIVCVRAIPRRAWRLPSWDRFEVPVPFTTVAVRAVALDAPGRDGIEAAVGQVARILRELGDPARSAAPGNA